MLVARINLLYAGLFVKWTKSARYIAITMVLSTIITGCASVQSQYETARSEDTVAAYEKILEKHPQSEFADKAKDRIEKLHWQRVQSINNVEEYLTYIQNNPESSYIELAVKAKDRLEELNWQRVHGINTVEEYLAYMRNNPESSYLELSIDNIMKLIAQPKRVILIWTSTESNYIREILVDFLNEEGFTVVSDNAPITLHISGSQKRLFTGTAASYWHPYLAVEYRITCEHQKYGRLYTKTYSSSVKYTERMVKFKNILVSPIQTVPTYIDTNKGTLSGGGIQVTGGSRDPEATTSVIELRKPYWDKLGDKEIRQQMQENPPMRSPKIEEMEIWG